MKITYTSNGITSTIEKENDDINIDELGEILYNICISQSWSPILLKKIFKKNIING